MEKRRKEKKPARLGTFAGGSRLQHDAQESDSRALDVDGGESAEALPNEIVLVRVVESIPGRSNPVNRPTLRFTPDQEVLQEIPVLCQGSNQ